MVTGSMMDERISKKLRFDKETRSKGKQGYSCS